MLSTFTYYFVVYFSIYKNSLIFRRKILTNILGLNFLQNSPKISTCSETFICLFILAERRERSEFIVSSRAKRARSQHVNRALVLVAVNLDAPSLVPRRSLLTCCPREVWERAGEYLSVTSQLRVESRIDRAENAKGLGWDAPFFFEYIA